MEVPFIKINFQYFETMFSESRDEDDHQSPNHEPDDANEVDDNDYDDVVEVEEDKQSEDGGDDNVAQHDSGSDNEQDEALEDDKLNQTDNFNVRGMQLSISVR